MKFRSCVETGFQAIIGNAAARGGYASIQEPSFMARNYHVAKVGEVHLNAFPDGSGATVYLCKIAGGDLVSTLQPAAPTDDPTADTSQSADEAIYAADQAAAAASQADADAAAEIDRTNSASGADVAQDQGDD